MLVLSRKISEIIDITTANGDKIEVTIVNICGDKVRVGVAADQDTVVHRREISERIEAIKKESAQCAQETK